MGRYVQNHVRLFRHHHTYCYISNRSAVVSWERSDATMRVCSALLYNCISQSAESVHFALIDFPSGPMFSNSAANKESGFMNAATRP